MFDEIKKHPYVLGGAVLGIIVLFFLMSSGGGTVAADSTGTGSDVSAAEATNQAGIMANAAIAQQQLSLEGLKEQIGGSVAIATLQAHTADNANTLAAAVAAQQINAESGSRDLATTLNSRSLDLQTTMAAQTQQRYFQSTETLAAINSNTMIENTKQIAGALVSQAQISSNTTLGVASYNAAIANQQISSNERVATQSWWDSIF